MSSIVLKRDQKTAVSWMLQNPQSGVFLDPGMGKTGATLKVLELLKTRKPLKLAVVVAPSAVARTVWDAEIRKWGFDLTTLYYLGEKKDRFRTMDALLEGKAFWPDILIVSYEFLDEFAEIVSHYKLTFQALVLDEASRIKNVSSKRFKAAKRMMDYFTMRWALTGTPAGNSLLDLFGPCRVLSPKIFGSSRTRFREQYFHTVDYYGYKWAINPGGEEEIHKALKPWALTMRSDGLDRPELRTVVYDIFLSDHANSLYHAILQQFVATIGDKTITAANRAVVTGKLRQTLSGQIYDDKGVAQEVHSERYARVCTIVDELVDTNTKVAILYQFNHERETLLSLYPEFEHLHAGLSRERLSSLIERWNRGEIPGIVGHPSSMGEGLNLQEGGHHLVWFSLPWSWEKFYQTRGRFHRPGQSHTVVEHVPLARGTVDEEVFAGILEKKDVEDRLFEALSKKEAVHV